MGYTGTVEQEITEDGLHVASAVLWDEDNNFKAYMSSGEHETLMDAVMELTSTLDSFGVKYVIPSDIEAEMNPLGDYEDILNENNNTITIDVVKDDSMYRVEAEIMLPETAYLTVYTFDPQVGKNLLERKLRKLGYTGEFLQV